MQAGISISKFLLRWCKIFERAVLVLHTIYLTNIWVNLRVPQQVKLVARRLVMFRYQHTTIERSSSLWFSGGKDSIQQKYVPMDRSVRYSYLAVIIFIHLYICIYLFISIDFFIYQFIFYLLIYLYLLIYFIIYLFFSIDFFIYQFISYLFINFYSWIYFIIIYLFIYLSSNFFGAP